jgi:hypothetical protein
MTWYERIELECRVTIRTSVVSVISVYREMTAYGEWKVYTT